MGDSDRVRKCVRTSDEMRGRKRARKKRRYGNRAKELLACFAEAGKQAGKLSDEAVLDVVRCCREKKTKASQSGTKDGKGEVFPGYYVEGHSGCEPRNRGSQEEDKMPVYICRWPNGDFSVASAANKERAIELLDEIGNAEGAPISVIEDFMIHFELKDSGDLEFESFGEATEGKIMEWGYPLLDDACAEFANGSLGDDERAKVIRQAVDAERQRVLHKTKEPEMELGKRIKGLTDAPAGTVNAIVKTRARRSLEKFRGKRTPY
jgi:hypothetical protein